MQDFNLSQARSVAADWNIGHGALHEFSSKGVIFSYPSLLAEVEGCLIDLRELSSQFADDEKIIGELARVMLLRHWIRGQMASD